MNVMDMENRNGKTGQDMRVFGEVVKQMEEAFFIMQMETFMKEIGSRTRHMVKERIRMRTERSI